MDPKKRKAARPGTRAASKSKISEGDATNLGAAAQRQRLLAALRRQSISTLQARRHLTVMHPAARVMELRKSGLDIATVWCREADENGVLHRIARYVLQSGGAR